MIIPLYDEDDVDWGKTIRLAGRLLSAKEEARDSQSDPTLSTRGRKRAPHAEERNKGRKIGSLQNRTRDGYRYPLSQTKDNKRNTRLQQKARTKT